MTAQHNTVSPPEPKEPSYLHNHDLPWFPGEAK